MTATEISIRTATLADAPALDTSLRALSETLGDHHAASIDVLKAAAFGDSPCCRAVLAEQFDGTVVGVCILSPVFSSTSGSAGTYVSDLWVAPTTRGSGLGRKLLAGAYAEGAAGWNGRFIRLHVDRTNENAYAAYVKLGFRAKDQYDLMNLEEAGCRAL